MKIRFADIKDKSQVLNLLNELLNEIARVKGENPTHEPVIEVGDKMFNKLIMDERYKIFVADENGELSGLATLFLYPALRRGNYRAHLEEFVVAKKLRGRGIGSAIMQAVIAWCKTNNISSMRLNSELKLTNAHKFYERNGGKFKEKMFKFDF